MKKEEFVKNPFGEISDRKHPDDWVILALEVNEEFRESLFSLIENQINSGDDFHYVSMKEILHQLSEPLREELFIYACRAMPPSEWYESFLTIVGPINSNMKEHLKTIPERWRPPV